MSDFASRFKKLLDKKGYTASYKFADKIEASPAAVRNWILGRSVPTVYFLNKICKLLDCSADWLVNGSINDISCNLFVQNDGKWDLYKSYDLRQADGITDLADDCYNFGKDKADIQIAINSDYYSGEEEQND